MSRAAYALINLVNLQHNLTRIRKIANQSKVMAVVKADAYGHGAVKVCQYLGAADALAVTCISEALSLRESGIAKPVLALQGFSTVEELQAAIAHRIQVVLHHAEQLKILQSLASPLTLNVYIKLDTGMHRLGFDTLALNHVVAILDTCLAPSSNVNVMTHLACADEPQNPMTQQQLEHFDRALKGRAYQQSIANSAGILAWPQSHRDWVRPGLMLYGISPLSSGVKDPATAGLLPVMSFRAPIMSIKKCKKGDKIGYSGGYCCPHDMVVGMIAAGYADGYPRHLCTRPKVFVQGQQVPIVGHISMDLISVDLSRVSVGTGCEVELWGNEIPVTHVARAAETISYELLCAAGNCVPRKYIE